MNSESNGFFTRMCKEAMNEVASGEKGWREADTNTLLLACFGYLTNHLTHKITKPLWTFVGIVATAVVGWLINLYV